MSDEPATQPTANPAPSAPPAVWHRALYRKDMLSQRGVMVLMRRQMVFIPTDKKVHLGAEMAKALGSTVSPIQTVTIKWPQMKEPLEPWIQFLHDHHGQDFEAYVKQLAQMRGGGIWIAENTVISGAGNIGSLRWSPVFDCGGHVVWAFYSSNNDAMVQWILYDWVHSQLPDVNNYPPITLSAKRPVGGVVLLIFFALAIAIAMFLMTLFGFEAGEAGARIGTGITGGIALIVSLALAVLAIKIKRRSAPTLFPPDAMADPTTRA